ncbi:hypothetical protein DICVIV_14147, partial [Dictyocaulus viviparus]
HEVTVTEKVLLRDNFGILSFVRAISPPNVEADEVAQFLRRKRQFHFSTSISMIINDIMPVPLKACKNLSPFMLPLFPITQPAGKRFREPSPGTHTVTSQSNPQHSSSDQLTQLLFTSSKTA